MKASRAFSQLPVLHDQWYLQVLFCTRQFPWGFNFTCDAVDKDYVEVAPLLHQAVILLHVVRLIDLTAESSLDSIDSSVWFSNRLSL